VAKGKNSYENLLLVEGATEKRAIPELVEANGILWEKSTGKYIVYIDELGGVDQKKEVKSFIPDLPLDLPPQGLVHNTFKKNEKPVKFGVWIMPDNKTEGMLETFLAYLVKDESEALWQYSQQVVSEAKNQGANYKPTHIDKANIHTWLAWQDEPGNQLHIAVKKKILDPQHPKAQSFINWFKILYSL